MTKHIVAAAMLASLLLSVGATFAKPVVVARLGSTHVVVGSVAPHYHHHHHRFHRPMFVRHH